MFVYKMFLQICWLPVRRSMLSWDLPNQWVECIRFKQRHPISCLKCSVTWKLMEGGGHWYGATGMETNPHYNRKFQSIWAVNIGTGQNISGEGCYQPRARSLKGSCIQVSGSVLSDVCPIFVWTCKENLANRFWWTFAYCLLMWCSCAS